MEGVKAFASSSYSMQCHTGPTHAQRSIHDQRIRHGDVCVNEVGQGEAHPSWEAQRSYDWRWLATSESGLLNKYCALCPLYS